MENDTITLEVLFSVLRHLSTTLSGVIAGVLVSALGKIVPVALLTNFSSVVGAIVLAIAMYFIGQGWSLKNVQKKFAEKEALKIEVLRLKNR